MYSKKHESLVVRYFGSWSSYKVPIVPAEPLSAEEAVGRETYYAAYYDEDQLVRFVKMSGDQVERTEEYSYWENGKVRQRRMQALDGSVIVQQYDRRGRLVK